MKSKYIPDIKGIKQKGDGRPGRYSNPETWKSGPDLFQREKYYAYLKHKSQARFRNEPYDLTWADWQTLWPDDRFDKRGRSKESLCISRLNRNDSWNLNNCLVTERYNHLKRAKEFKTRE
jgi:hypothetical protein